MKTIDTMEDARLTTPLRIIEIFKSIQGESTWAGLPCVFVRLACCNLQCNWCDTPYAQSDGETKTIAEVLQYVDSCGLRLVEITGGEPLMQQGCLPLAELLLAKGYEVLVETNGSLPINVLPDKVVRIMDLKCPGSGMSEKNHWPNLNYLAPHRDEVKFVIASRNDYEWSCDILKRYNLPERCRTILFSAVVNLLPPVQLVEWILQDNLPVRFQLQLHKYVWPADQRGV